MINTIPWKRPTERPEKDDGVHLLAVDTRFGITLFSMKWSGHWGRWSDEVSWFPEFGDPAIKAWLDTDDLPLPEWISNQPPSSQATNPQDR